MTERPDADELAVRPVSIAEYRVGIESLTPCTGQPIGPGSRAITLGRRSVELHRSHSRLPRQADRQARRRPELPMRA